MIFGIVVNLQSIKSVIFPKSAGGGATHSVLVFILLGVLPGSMSVVNFISRLLHAAHITRRSRFIASILEIQQNLLALFVSWAVVNIATFSMILNAMDNFPWRKNIVAIFISLISICRLSWMKTKDSIIFTRKDTFVNLFICMVWVGAVAWLLLGLLGLTIFEPTL